MHASTPPRRILRVLAWTLALVMALGMLIHPAHAEPQTESLTGGAQIVGWEIGDTTHHYNTEPAKPTIDVVEEGSKGHLIDGELAASKPELFDADSDWVHKSWDDSNGGRALYVNFYKGDTRTITIDLGGVCNVNEIAVSLGISSGYGIPAPDKFSFYLSKDGQNFYKVGEATEVEGQEALGYLLDQGTMGVTSLNYNAQYVRIEFAVQVWVFMDELIVMGSKTASGSPADLEILPKYGEDDPSKVNAWPTYEMAGGIHHDYLAYAGWGTVGNQLTETYKTVDECKAAVAYLDENKVPVDKLFDSVTLIGHGWSKDGHSLLINDGKVGPAGKTEWTEWLNHIFEYEHDGAVTNLAALEQAMAEVKRDLKPSDENGLRQEDIDGWKEAVKISVYPAMHNQSNWGQLEAGDTYVTVTKAADGSLTYTTASLPEAKKLDFTLAGHDGKVEEMLSDRASAFLWYMKEAEKRFNEKQYQHLYLDGFYYYEEKASTNQDPHIISTIQIYNMMVDLVSKNYVSYWIPFYTGENWQLWSTLGFDYAVRQPNGYDGGGQARLDNAADKSKEYGAGIEMEWMGAQSGYPEIFMQYMQTGISKGYQHAPQAWYFGTWDLARLCYKEGNCANLRYLYDAVYKYIKGETVLSGENILSGAELKVAAYNGGPLDGYNLSLLTDGTRGKDLVQGGKDWGSGKVVQMNNSVKSPIEVTAALPENYRITELALDVYDYTSAGVALPYQVMFYVSADGQQWHLVGTVKEAKDSTYTLSIPEGVDAAQVRARIYKAVNPGASNAGDQYAWLGLVEFHAEGIPSTKTPTVPTVDSEKNLAAMETATLTLTDSKGATVVSSDQTTDLSVLTNGSLGDAWDVKSYYRWNGTAAEDPFTLQADLGEVCYVDAVALSFYDWAIGASVGIPGAGVKYAYSVDGQTWTDLGTVLDHVVVDNEKHAPEVVNVNYILRLAETVEARYIKAEFARSLDLNKQASNASWIALGEFTVEGYTEANRPFEIPEEPVKVDAEKISIGLDPVDGRPLNSTGQETLELVESCFGLLFDGQTAPNLVSPYNDPTQTFVAFNNGWTGTFDINDPDKGWGRPVYNLDMDLRQPHNLNSVSMEFLVGAVQLDGTRNAGIGEPTDPIVYLSDDGENWVEAGTMLHKVASSSGSYEKWLYYLRLDNARAAATAQYIRLSFQLGLKPGGTVYSFAMTDEIYIDGAPVSVTPPTPGPSGPAVDPPVVRPPVNPEPAGPSATAKPGPKPGPSDTPKTGDGFPLLTVLALMAASAAAIPLVLRKRKS